MRKAAPIIAVIVAMIIWAGSGIAVKEALSVFTPLSLIILRFSLAVTLMLLTGLIFKRNNLLGLQKIDKADIGYFLLGGFFQPFIYFILETYTYRALSSPTIAEAFLSTNPIIAPVFAWVFLREHITRNNIIGIVVSTIGMLALTLAGSTDFELGNPWGVPLALVTVCSAAAYSTILKKIPDKYSPITIVFTTQLISLCLFIPLWAIVDDPAMLFATLSEGVGAIQTSLLGVGYLGVFSSVVAFVLFCYCVRDIGVSQANVFNNIRPVFTAILMLILFSEHLPVLKWIGMGLIIIGLFISQKKEKQLNSL